MVAAGELKMAQVRVLKQMSRRGSTDTATEIETPRYSSLQVLEASTLRLIQTIDDAIAKA
jgi:hypothetical protein